MPAPDLTYKLLARLYPQRADAERVLDALSPPVNPALVDLDGSPIDRWFRIWQEIHKHDREVLHRLGARVHEEYPTQVRRPPVPPRSQDGAVAAYLEWGWRHHNQVRLLGYRNRAPMQLPLDQVFVPLQARMGRPQPGATRPLKLGTDAEVFQESVRVDLAGALRSATRRPNAVGLALLGDPGAGKTTLLKHLFCRVTAGHGEDLGVGSDRTPVFLRFADLVPEDLVPGGFAGVVSRQVGREGFPGAGRALASPGRRLFLLDGLDEVRDEPTREGVCRWLEDELARWPGSLFVATCRFAAWRRDARLNNRFVPVDVLWLDVPAQSEFVRRWFRAVEVEHGGRVEDADEKAEALVAVLADPKRIAHHRLREISGIPVLLSSLCLVHYTGNTLPEKRTRLYEECVGFLLETWADQRAGKPKVKVDPARGVLQPLAWAMHERQVKSFTGAEIRAALAEPFAQVQGLGLGLDDFLERVRDDCGLLTGKDLDTFEFLHLSFQEYLAAEHARAQGLAAHLADRAGDAWWREAILLAMALDGVFRPFMERLATRRRLAPHKDLLRECFDEAVRLDPAPFTRVLAARSPALPDVATILELFRGRGVPSVEAGARRWADHPDRTVRAAARALLGMEEEEGTSEAGAGSRPPFVHGATGMEWVWVPPGRFWMGSSRTPGDRHYDAEAFDDETPAHEVELTRGFWMGRHPVTNEEYGKFVAETGHPPPVSWQDRRFNEPRQPVVMVSFGDAQAFCAWLGRKGGLPDGGEAVLPTEAQWEYAARGNDGRKYPWGNEAPAVDRAWFGQEYGTGRPADVGGRPTGRSPFGCEDMAGNVWEWCRDDWRERYGEVSTAVVDPCHLVDSGSPRVVRGGSWDGDPGGLRCACRGRDDPRLGHVSLGFRVVVRVPPEHEG